MTASDNVVKQCSSLVLDFMLQIYTIYGKKSRVKNLWFLALVLLNFPLEGFPPPQKKLQKVCSPKS